MDWLNFDHSRCRGVSSVDGAPCLLRENCRRYMQYKHEFIDGFGQDHPVPITDGPTPHDDKCPIYLQHINPNEGWEL